MKILSLIFIFIFLFSFVYAQGNASANASGNLSGGIGEGIESIEDVKDKIDEAKYNFLATQWKEFFLKNKFIAPVNVFFEKINIVFVILFARDWSFGLEMLFVFMIWLFTLFSLASYFRIRFKTGWKVFLLSLGGTMAFAWLRVFNYLAKGAVKIIFYKPSTVWNIVMFILLMVCIFIYLKLNKAYSKKLKDAREKREQNEKTANLENKTGELENFKEGLKRGAGA